MYDLIGSSCEWGCEKFGLGRKVSLVVGHFGSPQTATQRYGPILRADSLSDNDMTATIPKSTLSPLVFSFRSIYLFRQSSVSKQPRTHNGFGCWVAGAWKVPSSAARIGRRLGWGKLFGAAGSLASLSATLNHPIAAVQIHQSSLRSAVDMKPIPGHIPGLFLCNQSARVAA